MSSKNILAAITSALGGLSGATVLLNADIPLDVGAQPIVIVRDGTIEVLDELLGHPRAWYMQLSVPVEVFVTAPNASDRQTKLYALIDAIDTALRNNAALLALVDIVDPTVGTIDTSFIEGGQSVLAAEMIVNVEYTAASSVG